MSDVIHVIKSTNDPASAPQRVGQHWFNTATKKMWMSKGTSTVADWEQLGVLYSTDRQNHTGIQKGLQIEGTQEYIFEGNHEIVSTDESIARIISWCITASGDIYNLVGDFVMWGILHNTSLDSNGDFTIRDEDNEGCQLFCLSEEGDFLYYTAPAGVGTKPTFTLTARFGKQGFRDLTYDEVTVANTTLVLGPDNNPRIIFNGTVGGQKVKLPDATLVSKSDSGEFFNNSETVIHVLDYGNNVVITIPPKKKLKLTLVDNSTQNGVWDIDLNTVGNREIQLTDDFVSTLYQSVLGWNIIYTGGTGSYAPQNSQTNHIGIGRISTAGTNNNAVSLNLGSTQQIKLGNGPIYLRGIISFPVLGGTGNSAYYGSFGLQDITSNADNNNGLYFEYAGIDATAIEFTAKSASGGVRTTVSTGVVVAANTFYALDIVVNSAGTSANYYINRNLVATINTNIPTALSAPAFKIYTGTSNAPRSMDVDYFEFNKVFPTVR